MGRAIALIGLVYYAEVDLNATIREANHAEDTGYFVEAMRLVRDAYHERDAVKHARDVVYEETDEGSRHRKFVDFITHRAVINTSALARRVAYGAQTHLESVREEEARNQARDMRSAARPDYFQAPEDDS